jgi:hypothetical protein
MENANLNAIYLNIATFKYMNAEQRKINNKKIILFLLKYYRKKERKKKDPLDDHIHQAPFIYFSFTLKKSI